MNVEEGAKTTVLAPIDVVCVKLELPTLTVVMVKFTDVCRNVELLAIKEPVPLIVNDPESKIELGALTVVLITKAVIAVKLELLASMVPLLNVNVVEETPNTEPAILTFPPVEPVIVVNPLKLELANS